MAKTTTKKAAVEMDEDTDGYAEQAEADDDEDGQEFVINLGEVPDELLMPEGPTLVRVESAQFKRGKVKEKGKPPYEYFNIELSSVDEPAADSAYFMVPRSLKTDSVKDKLRKDRRLKNFLKACGHPLDGTLDLNSLVGSEFWVEIVHREHEDRITADVKKIIPPPGDTSSIDPDDED